MSESADSALGTPSAGSLIFIEISGDESLLKADEHYPVFAAAAVIMDQTAEKSASDALRELFAAHDFTTREFRMALLTRGLSGDYRRLRDGKARSAFWSDLCSFVRNADFEAASAVLDKRSLLAADASKVGNVFEAVTKPLLSQLAILLEHKSAATLYRYKRGEAQNRRLATAVQDAIEAGSDLSRVLNQPPSDGRQNSAGFAIAQVLAGMTCRQSLKVLQKPYLRELNLDDHLNSVLSSSGSVTTYLFKKEVARSSRSTSSQLN